MINAANLHDNKEIILAKLNQLDREGEQYMQHTKKKCRRIKSGGIPFSPEASLWIRQCQVYRSLLRWHARKIRNRGNMKRTARQCRIKNPFFLSVEELQLWLNICKTKCNYFRKHGKWHRQQHLTQCLDAAKDREDEDAERKILAIIQGKKIFCFGATSTLHWANTFKVVVFARSRWKMEMVGSRSSTPRKGYRMQSSMRCIGSNTIWRRRPPDLPRFSARAVWIHVDLSNCKISPRWVL